MPFVAAEVPKCPKCQKSVYAAEERVAGGKKWHKQCFKCGLCNKMLDSTNANEHDDELFCRVCHARKFGPKGYGFGGGAGALSMDTGAHLGNTDTVSDMRSAEGKAPKTKAPEGEGCPRCGFHVYAAEQMLARGRAWHKGCYKCKDCNKHLDSVNTCEGPDNEIYCKVCYSKDFGPKGYGYGLGAGCLQSDALTVSDVDKVRPSKVDTAVIKAAEGQGCPRCGGAVFAAEQMLARGSVWHKGCFNCRECHRVLDSILACDGPDRDIYCKLCYAKKYGPKGYGFGCGSAFLMSDKIPNGLEDMPKMYDTKSIQAPEGQGCPRCRGVVFAAEQMLSKGREWHKLCFNCADCHRPLDSVLACDGPNGEIYCKACYGKRFGPKGFGYGHMPTLVSVTGTADIPTSADLKPGLKAPEGEGCPRCGYAVYAAEQMICKNKMWHRRCFNCAECHRSLDSTNLNDAPNNEIYCAGCYRKKFGPHGVGYGIGAGTLLTF